MKIEKKINIGLVILRIYLSFLVVTAHSFKPKAIIRQKYIIKMIYNNIHAPNFYILSFYFCYNLFKSKNIRKIKIRFQRLLMLQLLTGHVFMTVLWFQYDLIFITLSIFIIHLSIKENLIIYILINLQIFGIFFTHSN